MGRKLYEIFPGIRASIDYGHTGGAMLNATRGERYFVLEFWPGQGYGVTPDPEPFTIGAKYRFGTFTEAEECFLTLLREAQQQSC